MTVWYYLIRVINHQISHTKGLRGQFTEIPEVSNARSQIHELVNKYFGTDFAKIRQHKNNPFSAFLTENGH